jgi:hypothetical protein
MKRVLVKMPSFAAGSVSYPFILVGCLHQQIGGDKQVSAPSGFRVQSRYKNAIALQGCQIFLGTMDQSGEQDIPNGHKIAKLSLIVPI